MIVLYKVTCHTKFQVTRTLTRINDVDARALLVKRLEEAIRKENEVSNNSREDDKIVKQEPSTSSSVFENRYIPRPKAQLIDKGSENIENTPIKFKLEEESRDNEYIETESVDIKVEDCQEFGHDTNKDRGHAERDNNTNTESEIRSDNSDTKIFFVLDNEQRAEIVREVTEGLNAPTDLARKYKISAHKIRDWVKKSGQTLPKQYKKSEWSKQTGFPRRV